MEEFDMIIVGGGLSGCLIAARLSQLDKNLRIALLEQEPHPGGRLSSRMSETDTWGYGLGYVDEVLFEYFKNSCRFLNWENEEIHQSEKALDNAAILSGSQFTSFSLQDLQSDETAKSFAGSVGKKDWRKIFDVLMSSEEKDLPFKKSWKDSKKSAGIVVFHQIMYWLGVSDIFQSSTAALAERVKSSFSKQISFAWQENLINLLNLLKEEANFEPIFSCNVFEANYEDQKWLLETEKGLFQTHTLIVAQSPRQAIEWIDRDVLPDEVIHYGLRAKPSSLVTLSVEVDQSLLPSEVIFITSEKVQAVQGAGNELTFRAVIDFETSMNAPEVGKAIKRLKRSWKKLKHAIPEIKSDKEHFALLPGAWAHSCSDNEKNYQELFRDIAKIQQPHLCFCGDAYGPSFQFDQNIISSVTAAGTLLLNKDVCKEENED